MFIIYEPKFKLAKLVVGLCCTYRQPILYRSLKTMCRVLVFYTRFTHIYVCAYKLEIVVTFNIKLESTKDFFNYQIFNCGQNFVLKNNLRGFLISIYRGKLVQLRVLCVLSHQNWLGQSSQSY
jgi:hypothetical protein